MTVHVWSVFEDTIRYLKNMEIGNKKCVLQKDLSAMTPTAIGKKIVIQELIVWAFQYFVGACTIDSESFINYSP